MEERRRATSETMQNTHTLLFLGVVGSNTLSLDPLSLLVDLIVSEGVKV